MSPRDHTYFILVLRHLEVFASLGCYVGLVGNWLTAFRQSL